MKTDNNRGFTLIELLVVIAIIGLLSSVVLASLSTARRKGNTAAAQSQLKSLQVAMQLCISENNGNYPNSGGNQEICLDGGSDTSCLFGGTSYGESSLLSCGSSGTLRDFLKADSINSSTFNATVTGAPGAGTYNGLVYTYNATTKIGHFFYPLLGETTCKSGVTIPYANGVVCKEGAGGSGDTTSGSSA